MWYWKLDSIYDRIQTGGDKRGSSRRERLGEERGWELGQVAGRLPGKPDLDTRARTEPTHESLSGAHAGGSPGAQALILHLPKDCGYRSPRVFPQPRWTPPTQAPVSIHLPCALTALDPLSHFSWSPNPCTLTPEPWCWPKQTLGAWAPHFPPFPSTSSPTLPMSHFPGGLNTQHYRWALLGNREEQRGAVRAGIGAGLQAQGGGGPLQGRRSHAQCSGAPQQSSGWDRRACPVPGATSLPVSASSLSRGRLLEDLIPKLRTGF